MKKPDEFNFKKAPEKVLKAVKGGDDRAHKYLEQWCYAETLYTIKQKLHKWILSEVHTTDVFYRALDSLLKRIKMGFEIPTGATSQEIKSRVLGYFYKAVSGEIAKLSKKENQKDSSSKLQPRISFIKDFDELGPLINQYPEFQIDMDTFKIKQATIDILRYDLMEPCKSILKKYFYTYFRQNQVWKKIKTSLELIDPSEKIKARFYSCLKDLSKMLEKRLNNAAKRRLMVEIMPEALKILGEEAKGNNCKKLIIDTTVYRCTMKEMMEKYGYKNEDSAKTAKTKCLNKLRAITYELILKSNA